MTRRPQFTRLAALAPDPREALLREAIDRCQHEARRPLRLHLIAQQLRDALDEAKLHGVSDQSLLAVGHACAEAAALTVYTGTGVPADALGAVLALEAEAEGAANRDTALLIDAPVPARKRAAFWSLGRHSHAIDRARRVLARELKAAR